MSQKDIENYIKDQCDDICKLLCELIAIPTVNPPGQSYRQCVDYLCSKLKEYNISHQVIEVSIGDYPRYSILGGQVPNEARFISMVIMMSCQLRRRINSYHVFTVIASTDGEVRT